MAEADQAARDQLVQALVQDAGRMDGDCIVSGLEAGLSRLHGLLMQRLHEDVRLQPQDSLLLPVSPASEAAGLQRAEAQVELYQAIECDQAAREFGYLPQDAAWFLQRLIAWRLGPAGEGELAKQRDLYRRLDRDHRRLALADVLAKVLPESRNAPMVLFPLLPLAVQIETALAFDDRVTAKNARKAQRSILPPIADCRACRGAVLASGQTCPACGNPLWTFKWLTIAE